MMKWQMQKLIYTIDIKFSLKGVDVVPAPLRSRAGEVTFKIM